MKAVEKSQAQGPAAKDRRVRVLTSSTCRDRRAEREHLVPAVFPELRARIQQFGMEFSANISFGGRGCGGAPGGGQPTDAQHEWRVWRASLIQFAPSLFQD